MKTWATPTASSAIDPGGSADGSLSHSQNELTLAVEKVVASPRLASNHDLRNSSNGREAVLQAQLFSSIANTGIIGCNGRGLRSQAKYEVLCNEMRL